MGIKDSLQGKLNNSLNTVKTNISLFLQQVLLSWKDRCAKEALFLGYKDNIDLVQTRLLSLLDSTGIDY